MKPLFLIFCLALAGCENSPSPPAQTSPPPRFVSEFCQPLSEVGGWMSYDVVRDEQTKARFLVITRTGPSDSIAVTPLLESAER